MDQTHSSEFSNEESTRLPVVNIHAPTRSVAAGDRLPKPFKNIDFVLSDGKNVNLEE